MQNDYENYYQNYEVEGYKLVYLLNDLCLDMKHKIYRLLKNDDSYKYHCRYIYKTGKNKGKYCLDTNENEFFCKKHMNTKYGKEYLFKFENEMDKDNIGSLDYIGVSKFWNDWYNPHYKNIDEFHKRIIHNILCQEKIKLDGISDFHDKVIYNVSHNIFDSLKFKNNFDDSDSDDDNDDFDRLLHKSGSDKYIYKKEYDDMKMFLQK